jgi:prevent-host-death family protein
VRALCSNVQTFLVEEDCVITVTTLSSREFQQNASRAQKAAQDGPVFITSRGKTVHVLLSFEEYRRITGWKQSIADLLALPGSEDIELELPRRDATPRAADLS